MTRDGEKEISVYQAPEVNLPSEIPESIKRRMARLAKMSFASTLEAVEESFGKDRSEINRAPTRIGIVVGTAFGSLDLANAYQKRVILEGAAGASPSLFSGSVQNAIASQLSISFGVQGPTSTVTTMDSTTMGSFRLAYDWLVQGVCDHVILAIGDELSDFHCYGMADLGLPQAREFDPKSDRRTASAGEGIASFVLSREDAVRTQKIYCEISEIQLRANFRPPVERHFAGCFGALHQWSRHKKWLGIEPLCHAQLYGSMITGAAFEVSIAALQTSTDRRSSACTQITSHDEASYLTLKN